MYVMRDLESAFITPAPVYDRTELQRLVFGFLQNLHLWQHA